MSRSAPAHDAQAAVDEPRRAHTAFQWQLRGVLLELATIVTAAGAAIAAAVVTFRILWSGTALVSTPRGSSGPWVSDLHDFTLYATAAMWLASCAIVMCWVFTMTARAAGRFFARYDLKPPALLPEDSAHTDR